MLIALALGIEAGYNTPASGFQDIDGVSFALYASRNLSLADLSVSLRSSSYTVENSAYSLQFYGLGFTLTKNNWLLSPVLGFGPEYVLRKYRAQEESGYATSYILGFQLNFRFQKIHLFPRLYYEGLTDMETHAGFLGAKIGIGYEF
jgi:hypothetical protein